MIEYDENIDKLLSHKDIMKIIFFATKPWEKYISRDDRISLGYEGIWKAHQSYDKSRKNASLFGTYCVLRIKWKCKDFLYKLKVEKQKKENLNIKLINDSFLEKRMYYTANNDKNYIDDYIKNFDEKIQTILKYRFVDNHTLKEIATKLNCSTEQVRITINKALKLLKKIETK